MAGGRTYADRREYLINAVQRRRKEVRRKAIAYKGGHCHHCHREVHTGLQLPQETVAETSGEFREACPEVSRFGTVTLSEACRRATT